MWLHHEQRVHDAGAKRDVEMAHTALGASDASKRPQHRHAYTSAEYVSASVVLMRQIAGVAQPALQAV